MDVLGDLVDPERGSDTLWFDRPGPRSRSWSGTQFCIDAWKAGNLFRHYGVHGGSTIAVLNGPDEPSASEESTGETSPQTLLAIFGAWVLGAAVDIDPSTQADARLLVGPTAWLDDYELPPGSKAMGYGEKPTDPTVIHFEGERWSENPIKFPATVETDDVAIQTGSQTITHEQVLDAARSVVDTYGIEPDEKVELAGPISEPGTIAAGVVAPLLAGAAITVGTAGTLTVADWDGERVIRPGSVEF